MLARGRIVGEGILAGVRGGLEVQSTQYSVLCTRYGCWDANCGESPLKQLLPILFLVALAVPAISRAQPVAGRQIAATQTFKITSEGKTDNVVLDVLIPKTIAGRQQIMALDYTVRPHEVFDKDGHRYAQFHITQFPAELKIEIQADVYRYDLTTARRSPHQAKETKEALAQWLVYERYLEKHSPIIQQAAKGLGRGTDEATARACFDYVVKTLKKSDFTEQEIGAIQALRDRQGDCTEFADLFITLCRAKGIPARVNQGYLLETVKDTPTHDWAEVYLQDLGWVPFDPVYAHLGLRTSFSDLRPIYLLVERQRRNGVLNLNHFWNYRYEGAGPVKLTSSFTVSKNVDLRKE